MSASAAHADARAWRFRCESAAIDRGERRVLSDVSFEFGPGECTCLIGPNGAGKTSLILAMLGQLRPTAGRLTLNDQPVHAIAPKARARWASFVPNTLESMPGFTVFDVVAAGRYPHLKTLAPLTDADQRHIDEAVERCRLSDLLNRPVTDISSGELQKTLIASAIAQQADVMFLDEPTTALDPAYQIELAAILRDWRRDHGGVVMSCHELSLPVALESRIIALRDGRVAADGPAETILRADVLGDIYGADFDELTSSAGRTVALPRLA
jgi:iron complex transport system ATP-binding protein